MTHGRPPDFDELVGGDLEPNERERLRRVHDLLLEAGPPPELPPALEPRAEGSVVVPIRRPSRRRMAVAGILAAALAAVIFGAGVLVGGSGDGESAEPEPSYVVDMTGDEARASLAVFDADAAGNWPMRMTVQGLDKGKTYELWLVKDGRLEQLCGAFAAGDGRTVVELSAPYPLKTYDSWVVTTAGDERPILTQVAD
jgi:anti-sigma-K factor RskA